MPAFTKARTKQLVVAVACVMFVCVPDFVSMTSFRPFQGRPHAKVPPNCAKELFIQNKALSTSCECNILGFIS
jgi:hypothetical protein